MGDNEPTTGVTPGTGVTPAQAETEPAKPTGVTPVGDASAQGPGVTPDDPKDVAGLQNALRLARESERAELKDVKARLKASEEERDALKAETQSDQEKAIEAARKDAVTETESKWMGKVRHSEVRTALTAAGISQSELGLAAAAPEFVALEVNGQGQVEDLGKTVTAFKESHPALFASTSGPSGSIDGGARGTPSSGEQVRQAEADGDWRTSISLKNARLAEQARRHEVT